jgi:hypothetical protein
MRPFGAFWITSMDPMFKADWSSGMFQTLNNVQDDSTTVSHAKLSDNF